MALEDVFKGGSIVTGLAIGVGFSVIGPVLGPALRPLAKSLVKGGLMAYDQGRSALAELGDKTSDIVAEARHEMSETSGKAHNGHAESHAGA